MKYLVIIILSISLYSCSNSHKKFDLGRAENGIYQNNYFDLSLKYDTNWFLQDKSAMNKLLEHGTNVIAGDNSNLKHDLEASLVNTAFLFTIHKYEIGAPVNSNPALMIMVENISHAPGIKNGKDYQFHMLKGFKQLNLDIQLINDSLTQDISNHQFDVLQYNINKLGNSVDQEFLVTINKEFALCIILTYSTKEEREELYRIISSMKFDE